MRLYFIACAIFLNLKHLDLYPQSVGDIISTKTNVACYYHDIDPTNQNENSVLMNNNALLGVQNYFWAKDCESCLTQLTGKIVDGFFIEENYTYEDIARKCKYAIEQGTFLTQSKSSYRLYDFKASKGPLHLYEYPIFFKNDSNRKFLTDINKIVIFGDSLSDNGNLVRWTKILPFFPFWFGRFSNGPVWNEYVSWKTHVPVLNFAYGGAKSEGQNESFLNFLPKSILDTLTTSARSMITGNVHDYMDMYLNNYLTDNSYEQKKSKISDPHNTLYVIWMGGNDFLEKFMTKSMTENFFNKPKEYGGYEYVYKRLIQNIAQSIETLIAKGAKNVLAINIPSMGHSPAIFDINYIYETDKEKNLKSLSACLNSTFKLLNRELNLKIEELQKKYSGKAKIALFNVEDALHTMQKNINYENSSETFDYGFEFLNSNVEIQKSENPVFVQYPCYQKGYTEMFTGLQIKENDNDNARAHMCTNVAGAPMRRHVFWNNPHPSTYAHCWISYFFMQTLNKNEFAHFEISKLETYKRMCSSVPSFPY